MFRQHYADVSSADIREMEGVRDHLQQMLRTTNQKLANSLSDRSSNPPPSYSAITAERERSVVGSYKASLNDWTDLLANKQSASDSWPDERPTNRRASPTRSRSPPPNQRSFSARSGSPPPNPRSFNARSGSPPPNQRSLNARSGSPPSRRFGSPVDLRRGRRGKSDTRTTDWSTRDDVRTIDSAEQYVFFSLSPSDHSSLVGS